MEKIQTGQRIITTLPVHGHQNRLIYALTMLLIAKIIIFRLLGIRQGGINFNKNTELILPLAYNNSSYVVIANNVELNAVTGGINIIAVRESSKLTLYTYGSNGSTRFNGWCFGSTPLKVAWLAVGW